MWRMYFDHIINNNLYFDIFVFSLFLSGVFYFVFRRTENLKRKVNFLVAHIIFLFFPFVFSGVFWRCITPIFNCSPKMLMILGPIAGLTAIVSGFVLLPYVYRWSSKNLLIKNGFIGDFVGNQSRKLGIKVPEVYSINEIKPVAYSITSLKPAIFMSAGLLELLTRKEIESVLLHEIYHHKSNASFWKFSGNALKIFTPLAAFSYVFEPMQREETQADNYAVSVQKTDKHLISAKRKIGDFSF